MEKKEKKKKILCLSTEKLNYNYCFVCKSLLNKGPKQYMKLIGRYLVNGVENIISRP